MPVLPACVVVLACIVTVSLTGCAGRVVRPGQTGIGYAPPPHAGPLTAQELYPDSESNQSAGVSREWRDSQGRITSRQKEVRTVTDTGWRIEWRDEDSGGLGRVVVLDRSPDGAALLRRLEDHVDGRVSLFDPPLIVAPASIAPGESVTTSGRVRVVRLSDESRTLFTGTATQDVRYPEAGRVETVLTLKLGISNVERRRWATYGVGASGVPELVGEIETILVQAGVLRVKDELRWWGTPPEAP